MIPTRVPFAMRRMRQNVNARGNTITISWLEISGGTADPGTGAVVGGTETRRSATAKAFTYEAEAKSAVRQFAEVEAGDMIVDFLSDVEIDGKEGLIFTVAGRDYQLKEISEKLVKAWDVTIGDQKGLRTVLLKKAL